MKIKCIDSRCKYLTFGKVYEGFKVPLDDHKYIVKTDNGDLMAYSTDVFSTVFEVNIPSAYAKDMSALEKQFLAYTTIPDRKITYKDFLASMPKDSLSAVMYSGGNINIYAYDLEFVCTTEERAEEVYTALITLFKEE